MNVELTITELTEILLKMNEANYNGRLALKSSFCSKMAELLEEFKNSKSVASKTIAKSYLAEVKGEDSNKAYDKALNCYDLLKGINTDMLF